MSKKLKLYLNSNGKSKDISEKFLIFIVMENYRIYQKKKNSYIQIVMENLKIFQKNS